MAQDRPVCSLPSELCPQCACELASWANARGPNEINAACHSNRVEFPRQLRSFSFLLFFSFSFCDLLLPGALLARMTVKDRSSRTGKWSGDVSVRKLRMNSLNRVLKKKYRTEGKGRRKEERRCSWMDKWVV